MLAPLCPRGIYWAGQWSPCEVSCIISSLFCPTVIAFLVKVVRAAIDRHRQAATPHRQSHMFMRSQPTSCVYHAVRLGRNKERDTERMNRRARQEVGNTTLRRSDGRREGEIVVLVGSDLTKWRFAQKTTITRGWDLGWRDGWMDGGPLEFPFSTAIKTRSTEPHRIWRHGGSLFSPTKELLSSRPNLLLSPSCLLSS